MKLNEEKIKEVIKFQEQAKAECGLKASMIMLASSVLPNDGIAGFFIRKYDQQLRKAVNTWYGATCELLKFKINTSDDISSMIYYEERPISTKEEFYFCKQKFLNKNEAFRNSSEWLKVKEKDAYTTIVVYFLKKLEEAIEEE